MAAVVEVTLDAVVAAMVVNTPNGSPDRHYFASLLIASGTDVKVVQARLRHASAKTTLDTYGHLWPDKDESTRAAIDVAMTAREDKTRDSGEGGT